MVVVDYNPLYYLLIAGIIVVLAYIANKQGMLQGIKGRFGVEPDEDPDYLETATTHQAVYNNTVSGDNGYIDGIHPGAKTNDGDWMGTIVVEGEEKEVRSENFLIRPTYKALNTGIYVWEYSPGGVGGIKEKEIVRLKDLSSRQAIEIEALKSQLKDASRNTKEQIKRIKEDEYAAWRGTSPMGENKRYDRKKEDDENEDKDYYSSD